MEQLQRFNVYCTGNKTSRFFPLSVGSFIMTVKCLCQLVLVKIIQEGLGREWRTLEHQRHQDRSHDNGLCGLCFGSACQRAVCLTLTKKTRRK